MNKFNFLLLIIFITLPLQSAKASVLIEPYAGYSLGKTALTTSATFPIAAMRNLSTNGTINGLGYGLKVAYKFPVGFYVGGEYEGITATYKIDNDPTSSDWTQYTAYGIAGYDFPFGFRIYGGYGFLHKSTDKDATSSVEYTGSAYKAGVGYKILPLLSVNFSYAVYTLKDGSSNGVNYAVSTYFSKYEYSAYMISVSVPFDMGGKN